MLGGWIAFLLASQRWLSWEDGLRIRFAWDMRVYEVIARAAPGFPDTDVLRAYAQRFPVHWIVGSLQDVTDTDLHSLYRLFSVLCVLLVVVVTSTTLVSLGLDVREHVLALGVVAASAYPLHYVLAAPGMLADGVFVLGLAVLLLGFVRGRLWVTLAGLTVALLGRQTAVPVALAAAAWAAFHPAWREARTRAVLSLLVTPAVAYAALYLASDSFSKPREAGLDDLTVLGFLTGVRPFAEHVGLVVLGIAIPAALVLGAWLRTRNAVPWGPLVVAVAVIAQPLLLGPLANASNEPRLAGLATPALAVAAGMLLRGAALGLSETIVCAAAIAVGGLHHRYTVAPWEANVIWASIELAGALVVLGVLAAGRGATRSRPASL